MEYRFSYDQMNTICGWIPEAKWSSEDREGKFTVDLTEEQRQIVFNQLTEIIEDNKIVEEEWPDDVDVIRSETNHLLKIRDLVK